MPKEPALDVYDDARLWNERGQFWAAQYDKTAPKASRKASSPVVVSGNGVALRVRNGALEITHGRSCASQEPIKQIIHSGKFRRPNAIILVHCSGFLTIEAMEWIAQHDIPLMTMDWGMKRTAVLTSDCNVKNALTYNEELVREQRAIAADRDRSLAISKVLIAEKIRQQGIALKKVENWFLLLRTPSVDISVMKQLTKSQAALEACLSTVANARSLDEQNGIEGKAAYAYFTAWQSIPLHWSGTARKPIPDDWYYVGRRRSLAPMTKTAVTRKANRHATHPLQAMINYGYAILQARLKFVILCAGLNPEIGIGLHGHGSNKEVRRPALIMDLIEPFRGIVDAAVLLFALGKTFRPQDFAILSGVMDVPDGAVRLHPQLARNVVKTVDEAIAPKTAELTKQLSSLPAIADGNQHLLSAPS
jgi:CRISPR-associated endonuclease Cas1